MTPLIITLSPIFNFSTSSSLKGGFNRIGPLIYTPYFIIPQPPFSKGGEGGFVKLWFLCAGGHGTECLLPRENSQYGMASLKCEQPKKSFALLIPVVQCQAY